MCLASYCVATVEYDGSDEVYGTSDIYDSCVWLAIQYYMIERKHSFGITGISDDKFIAPDNGTDMIPVP